MIISGPQRGPEGAWVQMNCRLVDSLGFGIDGAVGVGANLRGHLAFLDLDASTSAMQVTTANVPFGQSCTIGMFGTSTDFPRSPFNALLGMVDEDLFLGKSPLSASAAGNLYQTNFWVKIRNYGHTDRLRANRSLYAVTDEFLFAAVSDLGVAQSSSEAVVNSMNSMTGVFTFDAGGGGAGDKIDLLGIISTGGTWDTPPITARAANKPKPTQGFLGYSYTGTTSGAIRNIPELNSDLATWNSGIGEISGFICCQSPSPRG